MCGILFHAVRRGQAETRAYAAALDHMRNRGPDHRAITHGEGYVIGHTRLAIIDPTPGGDQPFSDAAQRFLLTYNGEIYNHAVLRADLEACGVRFATKSDTEVLLQALITWGIETTLRRVRGMFAFVLHDVQTGETVAARDHFGQKPLYYVEFAGGLVIASDPLAVTEITGDCRPDLDAYALYMATPGESGTRGLHHPRRSFFDGVAMLPAGHLLRYRDGQLSMRRFFGPWELFDPDRYHRRAEQSESELLTELSALLEQSVRRHLVADVPMGALLSGGIDSSMLYWLAVEHDPTLQTFTKLSPGIETIPLTVVPRLLQQRSATAHFITQDRRTFVADLESFIIGARAPSRWNSGPSMLSLCRAARRNGVIALFGGDCADEIFGGYLQYENYFARRPALDDLGERVGAALGPGLADIVQNYLAEQQEVRRSILDTLSCIADPRERQEQATLLHETTTFLQTCALPHSDAYSMMASVELRNPMLDLDLVEFAVNLPMRHKAAPDGTGQFGKRLFRVLATREVGDFINVRKEGTRNYAMAMADPQFWHLHRFETAWAISRTDNLSKRQIIRMINLELFHNAFFAARRRPLEELMTATGRRAFQPSAARPLPGAQAPVAFGAD